MPSPTPDSSPETETPRDPGQPPERPRLPPLSLTQVLALVGLLAGLLVAVDLNQRMDAAEKQRAAADHVATEVAALEAEQSILQTQVAYATTDAAVIQWARESGKMVLPGEVLVVPVLPTPQPTPPQLPPAPTPPPPKWELWRDLFFGS